MNQEGGTLTTVYLSSHKAIYRYDKELEENNNNYF